MRNDPDDASDVHIRRATSADAQGIALAHLDSIRSLGPAYYPADVVETWSAGLRPDIYATAMDDGEAFFVATGTLDGDITVLQLDAHTDLRDTYCDTKWGHGCVSRRMGGVDRDTRFDLIERLHSRRGW